MRELNSIAAFLLIVLLAAHIFSTVLAIIRCRKRKRSALSGISEPISVLRPVCGVDQHDALTLGSSFGLDHPNHEILFCCEKFNDPAVRNVYDLISAHPSSQARLLIGRNRSTGNPKLNNLVKGWAEARHDWIVMADSNVLMPTNYIERLMGTWRADTGLVCCPPIGSRPEGLWAELECAFLNTYQARWQYAADTLGFGFAQGKSMLWRRDILDDAGGICALGREIAEDAAATKIVRAAGLRVRLVDGPFEQPLGFRSAKQVWDRQLRWSRLRRATFKLYFAPEILTGIVPAILAVPFAAGSFACDPVELGIVVAAIWYGAEYLLARLAGWHIAATSPIAWILRDLTIPALWLSSWFGAGFNWRGNEMSISKTIDQDA